jgi:multiple sugar transport system ATP-binding protein
MPEVVLENLCRRYRGGAAAVADLSLRIGDGELMVLVGPSGSGKTTTLRLIAGLERPDEGRVLIGGRDVRGVPPHRRDVAVVFQSSTLYPHMTVRRSMELPLRGRFVARAEASRRVRAVAESLGIAGLLDRRPHELSGGERQRVALGKALVREPGVLLLDEPLSSLEPSRRAALRDEIRALHRRVRATMVYVTHDQEEAMALGDRIAVISAGRLRQVGTGRELYETPADCFVAGFIGTPAMNFLEGRVERESGGAVFVERTGGGVRIAMTGEMEARAGVLGVRPTDLAPDSGGPLVVVVEESRFAGDAVDLVCRTVAGARVLVRWRSGGEARVGDRLRLAVRRSHFFAGEAGANAARA